MNRILFLSFFIVGLLVASEPSAAGPASGAAAPECPICTKLVASEWLHPNNAPVTTTPLFGCDHPETFHAGCLAQLLQANGAQTRCPMCRQPLLAIPGLDLPTIIQAALPARAPLHIANINQITHRYDAARQFLDLSSLNIAEIDGIVFRQINDQWPNLKGLDLSKNPLAVLPAEIGQLHNLEWLRISFTPLAALPVAEMGQLHNLRELSLNDTQLVYSPNWGKIRQQLQDELPLLQIMPSKKWMGWP